MTTLKIENGPCELDLFNLGLARRKPMEFNVEDFEKPLVVIINGIEAGDGSCKNWLLKGYVQGSGTNMKFKMFFSYKQHRTGWIKLESRS
jgi:hypothetical protein